MMFDPLPVGQMACRVGVVMHLSMPCPTSPPPGYTGAYRGFDKLKCQLPLYGAIISCQIPYIASVPTMGI